MKPSSLSSPFRIGGRGSKQLSKAIEKSNSEKEKAGISTSFENTFALCTGSSPCFAKILSAPSSDSFLIQPMHPNDANTSLFVPWDGLVWLAKRAILYPVAMKQELGGWRVQYTPELYKKMRRAGIDVFALEQPQQQPNQLMSVSVANVTKKEWDVVTLEGSDLEDCSSVDSLLFPKPPSPITIHEVTPPLIRAPPTHPSVGGPAPLPPPLPPAEVPSGLSSYVSTSPESNPYRYRKLSTFQYPRRYECSPVSATPSSSVPCANSNGWAKMHFGVPLSPPVLSSPKNKTPERSDVQLGDLSPPNLRVLAGESYPMTAVLATQSTEQQDSNFNEMECVVDSDGGCDDDVRSTTTWCQEDSCAAPDAEAGPQSPSNDKHDDLSERLCNASVAIESPVRHAVDVDESTEPACGDQQASSLDDTSYDEVQPLRIEPIEMEPIYVKDENNVPSPVCTDVSPCNSANDEENYEQQPEVILQEVEQGIPLEQNEEPETESARPHEEISGITTPLVEVSCTSDVLHASPLDRKRESECTTSLSAVSGLTHEMQTQSDCAMQAKSNKRRRRSQLDILLDVAATPTSSPAKRVCGIANLPKGKLNKSPPESSPTSSTPASSTKPPLRTKRPPEEAPRVLPSRSARAKSSDYSARDAFLGSWPTRHQAFATGTWEL